MYTLEIQFLRHKAIYNVKYLLAITKNKKLLYVTCPENKHSGDYALR